MTGAEIWVPAKSILMMAAGGFFTWLFSKLKTRRENRAVDLELIERAISPLLKSIGDLTGHVGEITAKLVAEQEKNLKLLQENATLIEERRTLISKVESLEKKVTTLTNLVKKWQREYEKDTPALVDS